MIATARRKVNEVSIMIDRVAAGEHPSVVLDEFVMYGIVPLPKSNGNKFYAPFDGILREAYYFLGESIKSKIKAAVGYNSLPSIYRQMIDQLPDNPVKGSEEVRRVLDKLNKLHAFHTTLTPYSGIQTTLGKPTVAVMVNQANPPDDPELRDFINDVHKRAFIASHPSIKGRTIGWARVVPTSPDTWYVEEVQSDFAPKLRDMVNQGHKDYSPEKVKELVAKAHALYWGDPEHFVGHAIHNIAKNAGVKHLFWNTSERKQKDSRLNKAAADKLYTYLPQRLGMTMHPNGWWYKEL